MSERNRTKEEYLQRHADQQCDGNTEAAAEHAIVKEVLKTLEKE